MRDATIDGRAAADWTGCRRRRELAQQPNVLALLRTTAFGYYDGNLIGAVERVADHLPAPPPHVPRQRLWKIRAQAVVLATGALERAIAYADNDLPGTMLAGAARTYVQRYGVRPGSRAVVFTNNDSAYAAALDLHAVRRRDRRGRRRASRRGARWRAAGARARRGNADHRRHPRSSPRTGACASRASTSRRLPAAPRSASRAISCACPAASIRPCISSRRRAARCVTTMRWRRSSPTRRRCPSFPRARPMAYSAWPPPLTEGHAAGANAAARAGRTASLLAPPRAEALDMASVMPLWAVPARRKSAKRFVDLQNDVTVNDIALAAREGYQAVEHLKRYTTLGMGTDQGKTSNLLGTRADGRATRRADPECGHDDVPSAVHAGDDGRGPRTRKRPRRRTDPLLGDARMARGARRAVRQRGSLETAPLVSARGRNRGRRGEPRSAQRAHQRRRRRRVDARQDRVAGPRRRRIPEPHLYQQVGHARRRAAAATA